MNTYLNNLFFKITEELDLTESQEKAIEKAYNAVADWLNRNNSALDKFDIVIYPQGSMKLGTVVKPLSRDDYDVDMVCLLQKNTWNLDACQVKNLIGDRLKTNKDYNRMLKTEGKRCWTLQYSDNLNFHMDILPAIPYKGNSILATHKQNGSYRFISTNPHEYAKWFQERMLQPTNIVERGNIEKLPEYSNKKPLQKVIQLLKRHRDVMFLNNQDHAPASIIITTIAGRLYSGETDLVDLFKKVISKCTTQIEDRHGVLWVPNPVNSNENFADKWKQEPQKKEAFYSWVTRIRTDFDKLITAKTSKELINCLYAMFGQKVIDISNNELGGYDSIVPNSLIEKKEIIPYNVQQALSVSYRQKAPWKVPSWSIVDISATVGDGVSVRRFTSGDVLEKEKSLTFKAIHSIQHPYRVKWQVTNTGREATLADSLRGDFYDSDDGYPNIRTESTLYSGIHYVQCFILKGRRCVAKSREFIVNIK